jgi:branched-chain amino acid transport system substrate-binding protein
MQIANTFFFFFITAVIGHYSTDISYFVKDLYERNGVVMLTPKATGTNLLRYDSQYIFRLIANNRMLAAAIAAHMAENGMSRVAIYHSEYEYGTDFSYVLEDEMSKRGIIVIDRVTSITPANIGDIMERWRAFGCHAVVLAAIVPDIIEPAQLIRRADPNLPIFGADNLQNLAFTDAMEYYDTALYVASYLLDETAANFIEAFRATYGHNPSIHTISGYLAVNLLADAINAVGTIDSTAIAGFLSELEDYNSIVGTLSFNRQSREFDGFNINVSGLSTLFTQ